MRKLIFALSGSQLLLNCVNADLFAVFAHTLEFDCTVDESEESVVRTLADVVAGMDVSASLLYEDIAGKNKLTVCSFCAKSLGLGVTTVTG